MGVVQSNVDTDSEVSDYVNIQQDERQRFLLLIFIYEWYLWKSTKNKLIILRVS